jgi:hypothetical protein
MWFNYKTSKFCVSCLIYLMNINNILKLLEYFRMNIGTTSIDSLPISTQHQQQPMLQQQQQQQAPMQMQMPPMPMQQQMPMQYSTENIRLEVNNNNNNVKVDNPAQLLQQNRDNDPSVMQKNMNQFVTGIQQASAAGMTALPARDIPQSQDHLIHDQQIKPNFIPNNIQQHQGEMQEDYIANSKTSEDIIRENMRRQTKTDSLDSIYNDLQIPILLGVLYFLFSLPIVRKSMFKYIPMLFNKDGNLNLGGYVSNSVLFGVTYYVMIKFINHFSM